MKRIELDDGSYKEYYYNDNGKCYNIVFYNKQGKIHRSGDEPAFLEFDQNEKPIVEEYYKNGICHRGGDKPAYINYNLDGTIIFKEYIVDGIKQNDEEVESRIKRRHILENVNKETNKVKISKTFSITKSVFEEYVKYCKDNSINRSLVVEKLILEWMEGKVCQN